MFLIVCAILAAGISSTAVHSQDQLPELVRRIKPSAVAIETFDARGEKLARGSGFFIDVDRVVTNRHVIEGAYRAEVHLNSGHTFPVKNVLAVDAEGDVALLKVDAPANLVRPLSLDRTSPQEGESVVVIGNPFGLEGSVTNGIVSAVRDIPGFGRIIQITAPISPGSSGSPVVNMQGQVIGVATLQITGGQSVNFAIPSERIAQLGRTAQADTSTQMTLGDLVAASGRNKRARGLSSISATALVFFPKTIASAPCLTFKKLLSPTAATARPGRRRVSVARSLAVTRKRLRLQRKQSVSGRRPSRTSTSDWRIII